MRRDVPITFIDIGAHAGDFTRAVEEFCGIDKAILVEPQPGRVSELRDRFVHEKFRILQLALADAPGAIALEINKFDATTSILPVRRNMPEMEELDLNLREVVPCKVETLDSVAAEMSEIDLIKIDVQGAEHLVVKGGRKTLKRTRLIWCEVSFRRMYDGSALFNEMYALLNDNGFYLAAMEGGFKSSLGELLQADTLFIAK